MNAPQPLLRIKDLTVTVGRAQRAPVLLDRVSLEMPALSITALVGSSGSGKTTTGLAMLRLLPTALNIAGGEIFFEGRDLLKVPEGQMRRVRGGGISMVFQEPLHAFNPVFTIGCQIDEVLRFHTDLNPRGRRERAVELLDLVGLPDPGGAAKNYPHQLSGGMRQRAMIAQAVAAHPRLIIADEPTSNLDVTLQARVIELFKKLNKELRLSILLITHDLGMVRHMADHVSVMTEGKVVESGATDEVLSRPRHSYTRQLMEALNL
jgi:ABC-type dipeptide/oligopeptide/nickel transport system ATPase component